MSWIVNKYSMNDTMDQDKCIESVDDFIGNRAANHSTVADDA
jgi:hypothetical protein